METKNTARHAPTPLPVDRTTDRISRPTLDATAAFDGRDSDHVTRRDMAAGSAAIVPDPVSAAETILRRFGARAISMLSMPRTMEDGRVLPPRMSANDCYAAMEESCRKMARVAVRKYVESPKLQAVEFSAALVMIFPDPPAYLTRCIRSVISDVERSERLRDLRPISMDQAIAGTGQGGDAALTILDTLADDAPTARPEAALIDRDERVEFRQALAKAMAKIPTNYRDALARDMARERQREDGAKTSPESDKERQTVCRARQALSEIIKKECGPDNPFVRLLAQQRSSRVTRKTTPSATKWTSERQNDLFRRLLDSSWQDRAEQDAHPEGNVEEAIVNEVGRSSGQVAPPSPEMRQAMRVMDTYTLEKDATAQEAEAQNFYKEAQKMRRSGKIEAAIELYRQAYARDPRFFAAQVEVGVMLAQLGNLRDALKAYLEVVEHPQAGAVRFLAATNAADIYLTWFDAGRNKERNIERAQHYAKFAMQMPTPMRACNLVLAYVKDRYYREAQQVMDTVLRSNLPDCPSEKFLQTLFQIRDADLIAWWNWLDGEMATDKAEDRG